MASKRPTDRNDPRVKPPTNIEKALNAPVSTFHGKIVWAINDIIEDLLRDNPDAKHNVGNLIGEQFLWDEIAKYAKAMSEKTWKALEKVQDLDIEDLTQGDHMLLQSPHFVITASVSAPVKRFAVGELARVLKEKYKIPEIISKELIDKAKVPTKSTVTIKIVEKSNA
jgi:hypothetical protein